MKYYWHKTNDQPPNTFDGHLFVLEYRLVVIVLRFDGSIKEFLVSYKKQ